MGDKVGEIEATDTVKDGSEVAKDGVYGTSSQTAGSLPAHSGTLKRRETLLSLIYPRE